MPFLQPIISLRTQITKPDSLHHRSISRQFPSETRTLQDLILSTMTPPAQGMSRGLSATTTSEIMVAAVVIIFMLSVVFLFFYLYHKRYHGAMPTIRSSRVNSILVVPGHGTVPRRALDPAVIKSLPVVVFRSDDFKEGIECAVCLGELTDGEETRVLPKCNHRFHLDCIDMWFHSNNTCPLCRSPLCSDPSPSRTQVTEAPAVEGNRTAARDFPSNVLVWGSGDRISTGVLAAEPASTHSESSSSAGSTSGKAEGVLVIEIPSRVEDGFPMMDSPFAIEWARRRSEQIADVGEAEVAEKTSEQRKQGSWSFSQSQSR